MIGKRTMTDLYENLLRATDNTANITTEKQGTITKIQDKLCNVKEETTGLEHTNVPVINEVQVKEGDTVLLGFLDNNIYNPVVYGVIGRRVKPIIDVDNELSSTSENPVQNKTITIALNDKAGFNHTHLSEQILDLIDVIYPVGSIYMSVNDVNPEILFGGEWEQIKDKFLLSSGDVYTNGATGGSADAVVVSHTHTQQSHSHTNSDGNFVTSDVAGANNTRVNYSANGNRMVDGIATTNSIFHHRPATSGTTAINNATGVDGTGKNMPPYLVVNVWKRIN